MMASYCCDLSWKALTLQLLVVQQCVFTTDSTWWTLGQLQLPLMSVVGSGAICDNTPGLIGQQRRLCRVNPDVMISVAHGAQLAVRECQKQFRNSRWNCSTLPRDASVFGKVTVQAGTRETAVVYAMTSAAVVHAITRACSRGELQRCACDPTKVGRGRGPRGDVYRGTGVDLVGKATTRADRKASESRPSGSGGLTAGGGVSSAAGGSGGGGGGYMEWNWGGCSDNVKYGADFVRSFVDAREKVVHDARALMNLHNNGAGRRAVRKQMKLQCKCHGVSGSCATRTCWLAMHDFRSVGASLRRRYDGATRVQMSQEGVGLTVANRNHKRPTKADLVYLEESPDFCNYDPRTGSLGTAGRQCRRASLRADGCDVMCCGRGYDTTTVQRVDKCDCKFSWCCEVKCKECHRLVNVHTCKATSTSGFASTSGGSSASRHSGLFPVAVSVAANNDADDSDSEDNSVVV